MKESPADDSGSSIWPRTDWSGLGHAVEAVGKDPEQVSRLILRYRGPLEIYLKSTFPSLTSQKDELLQDFAQDKILREGWLGHASANRGKFRDFLKTSLRNYVKDRLRKAAKSPASLDGMELDIPAEDPKAELFDLNWARTILAETLARMEKDCKLEGKDQPRRSHIWELFQLRLVQPAVGDAVPVGYEDLVSRFALGSPFDAQNMLATAKRIFKRHLTDVISEYEGAEDGVRREIEDINRFLSGLSKKK